jgi:uncharacterized protein YegL
MDVGVIMDRSGSIGADNFRRSQDFVARLISHFEYASSRTRFGVIAYNAGANVIFKFNDAAIQNPKTLMSSVYGEYIVVKNFLNFSTVLHIFLTFSK